MLNFMSKLVKKVAKKATKKRIISKPQQVVSEEKVLTDEDIAQNPAFEAQGLVAGDVIEVVTGVIDEVQQENKPEARYFENKKVVKVATTVVNGKEYNEITTEDGCVYLDSIA